MNEKISSVKSVGTLKISQEVIASIVQYTAQEVDGVAGLATITPSFTGWLLEKQTVKPVSVNIVDGVAIIDVRICVESNIDIPEVCKKLQYAVKEAIQNMTGIVVARVNLQIAGIHFPNQQED